MSRWLSRVLSRLGWLQGPWREPSGLLVVAHGRVLWLAAGAGPTSGEVLGAYVDCADLETQISSISARLATLLDGPFDALIGADLAPCMVLTRMPEVGLSFTDWQALAATALFPFADESANFMLRLSGTDADLSRVACFVPKRVIDLLDGRSALRGARIGRCEPLAGLGAALLPLLGNAEARTGAAIEIVVGGIAQRVDLDAEGRASWIGWLCAYQPRAGARSQESGRFAEQQWQIDLDAYCQSPDPVSHDTTSAANAAEAQQVSA